MLSKEGCRTRQQRCARLAELDIDAAVINHPKEIYYFTGISIPEEYGSGDRDLSAAWL